MEAYRTRSPVEAEILDEACGKLLGAEFIEKAPCAYRHIVAPVMPAKRTTGVTCQSSASQST